jgi:hypothetical protein
VLWSLRDLIERLDLLVAQERTKEEVLCDVGLDGSDLSLSANRSALLFLASRVLKLADDTKLGAHFTIDQADIAPDATASLTISRS